MGNKVKITKRLQLYTGTKCNLKCKFCYYYNCLDRDNIPYEEIISKLKTYKKNNIKSIDITGGEPTIHKDLVKIIEKAVEMGFEDIKIITNGIALKNEKYLDNIIKAGIYMFVLSIHGPNAKIHDQLTGKKGSFNDMLKTIRNLNKRKFKYFINYVINKKNYIYLPEFAEFVNKECTSAVEVTFLMMNHLDDARLNFDEYIVRYSDMVPYLEKSIKLIERKKNIITRWKFMPLCPGKNIINQSNGLLSTFFLPSEWDYATYIKIEFGFFNYFFLIAKNFCNFNLKQLMNIQFKFLKHISLLNENFGTVFKKIEKCNECKYYYVCDGISIDYIKKFGNQEFVPVKGEKIINPLEFINKNSKLLFYEILFNLFFFIFSNIFYFILSKIIIRKRSNDKKYLEQKVVDNLKEKYPGFVLLEKEKEKDYKIMDEKNFIVSHEYFPTTWTPVFIEIKIANCKEGYFEYKNKKAIFDGLYKIIQLDYKKINQNEDIVFKIINKSKDKIFQLEWWFNDGKLQHSPPECVFNILK